MDDKPDIGKALYENLAELNKSVMEGAAKCSTEILLPKRQCSLNRLEKQIKIVTDLLAASNVERVNQEMLSLDQRLLEFMEINERYQGLADAHESNEAAIFADNVDSKVFELKRSVNSWLIEQDRASSHHSSRSSRSSKSHRSCQSHASNMSVDNRAQLESLRVQASFIENDIESDVKRYREKRNMNLNP